MEADDEDDMYSPDEEGAQDKVSKEGRNIKKDEDEEEGEEVEEEESDSVSASAYGHK